MGVGNLIIYCLLTAVLGKSYLALEYRLSKDLLPDLYDIHIKPYLRLEDGENQFTFDGQVNITLHTIVNNVKEITLHSKLTAILSAILYDPNGKSMENIKSESMLYNTDTDKLKIKLSTPLLMGKNYTLYFKYFGEIRDDREGFYRATNDNISWYGLTQLHRIHARTVFPCFDEPEFKAKFRMHISRSNNYKSFFNTRLIKSTEDGTERSIDHFEETPLMPTYLVAFVISDYESHGNEDFKIIIDAQLKNKINFAFEVGLNALDALGNYTQLPYRSLGNTIMQMFVTNHIMPSAMENWGLVYYAELALVHEPGSTDGWFNKQFTVNIVFHETAHMWFGNTVTQKWWSYSWLNEALPTYFNYFIAHEIYPEYELEKQFVVDLQFTLDIDATNHSQPLTSPEESINTPFEIASKFGNLDYFKGAAVICMFKNLMGKENFDMAIRGYLKENFLKTTEPKDLFKQLKRYWPQKHMVDLDEFFKDWTEQEGYPMVTVSKTPSGRFSIKQQRFLLNPTDGSDTTLKYTIPITYSSDKIIDFTNLEPQFYLNKTQSEMIFGDYIHHRWIIVNNQQFNYYRVYYDDEILKELKITLMGNNQSVIHINNRAGIVNDLFTYVRVGLRGYDEVLEFMEYLATETEYSPWQAAFKGFDIIYQRLTLAQHNKFGEFLFDVLEKVYQKLGFENSNDSVLDVYSRNKIISWLCKYHHEHCNAQAQAIFNSHLSANTKPSPNFRETLYCAAVRNDNSSIYENLREIFLKEQLAGEKKKILRAMGCTHYNIKDHFDFLLTDNVAQELKTIGLNSLYSQTPENIMPVFKLIMKNTMQLTEVFQDWLTTVAAIHDIAQYLTTQEQLTLLKEFNKDKGDLVNSVEKNLKWSADHLGKLMNYLTQRNANYRLTKDIIPDSYDIYLKAYLRQEDGDKQFTFDGKVNITIQAKRERLKKIMLHKNYIDILEAILYDANGKIVENITSGSVLEEHLTEMLTVYLSMPLEVNTTYILYFKYQGQIRNGSRGVFRSTYDHINWYGITQLQGINARTAFPCFDEPEFKAKFRMHISRPRHYNSVFNTILINSTIDGTDKFVDHFHETPLMSTYSVGFMISDFESYGAEDLKLLKHSKLKNETYFAFEVALRTLKTYDNYTQLPYKSLGNPIMQMAGSSGFPHNDMGNWGLVIYKDSGFSHEPDYTDGWSDKEYTITTLAHATSHMWFGNSVTFKWWNCFWLNEAFARYYQYFMAHKLYPEYELDKQFIVNQVQQVLAVDATNFTQPLTSPEESINTPSEIDYKFSSVTSAKGATLVRMFANLMGKEKFHQAVRDYLRENHLKNVVPEILFKYLKKHWPQDQKVDLDELFSDWTEQVGYPVVSVSVNSKAIFVIKQKRFLLDPNDGSDAFLRYTIPITFNNNTKNNYDDFAPLLYFNKTLDKVELVTSTHFYDWILLNTQQSNYYRVFYSSDLLTSLRTAFEQQDHSGIHVSNRASVIDDLFAFGHSGLMGYDEIFEFIGYLATETEYTPWYAAFKGFQTLYVRLTLEQHKEFGKFVYEILDKVYKKLGFENSNDTVLDVYNRNKVISWLCKYHHTDCNVQAKHVFNAHMLNHTKPSPDFRETLYCAACRNDQLDVYRNLRELFEKEESLREKEQILRAMGCTRYNVEYHYKFILSNKVPHDLKMSGLMSLYTQTPENIMTVFKLMIKNVERLKEALQSWSSTASAISDISNYLTTQEQLKMLTYFIDQKGDIFGTKLKAALKKSIETSEINLKWADIHLDKLFNYLSQWNSAASSCISILIISVLLVCLINTFMNFS